METKEMTLVEFAERFNKGEFDSRDRLTQCIIYDDTMKDVRVDITPEDISPKPINAEVIDYTL